MMRPLGARALVKSLEAPKPASSLIIVPDTVSSAPSNFAVVLAVGTLQQSEVTVGDTVILKSYSGAPAEIELDGVVLDGLIVPEESILAIVEGL